MSQPEGMLPIIVPHLKQGKVPVQGLKKSNLSCSGRHEGQVLAHCHDKDNAKRGHWPLRTFRTTVEIEARGGN